MGLVAGLVALASFMLPTLSADDDYPEEMLWVGAAWFGTAIMAWREIPAWSQVSDG